MAREHAKDVIAYRCAQELKNGYLVTLGIGIPASCIRFFPKDADITLLADIGLVGQGPAPTPEEADPMHYVDANGRPTAVHAGSAIVDIATNFGLIRGGHVDACVLGALEADSEGSFSNWLIPGKKTIGMGGAMDLVSGAKRVILAMLHEQGGVPKIVRKCILPRTGYRVVDLIVTEMAVMSVTPRGLMLMEYNPELGGRELAIMDIQATTEPKLIISPDLKPMPLPPGL